MNKSQSVVVHNETELYLTIIKLMKPITIKPMDGKVGSEITLNEMECRGLLTPPGVNQCQCCEGELLPEYPFIVEEKPE
ncbi:MAG: hypothetical protein KAX49_12385 [Halanaerobiales bacterium]|nr:hypothetical protein [Halanaerobiales bacterium]